MNSAMISDTIMRGALPFLAQQRFVVLGTASEDGSVWASPVLGKPGFVSSTDGHEVRIDMTHALAVKRDILWFNLRQGAHMGILAIDLATRRRLRINGMLSRVASSELTLDVAESYSNCPKYIQRRNLVWDDASATPTKFPAQAGEGMTSEVRSLIESADTLFIATVHAQRGADVSHRGGNPGFVHTVDAKTMRIPDYPGNGLFNTMGNLISNSRAGITAMDFTGGRMVQATGHAQAMFHESGRFIEFTVDRWQLLPMPAVARWQFVDASPFNPIAQ